MGFGRVHGALWQGGAPPSGTWPSVLYDEWHMSISQFVFLHPILTWRISSEDVTKMRILQELFLIITHKENQQGKKDYLMSGDFLLWKVIIQFFLFVWLVS